MTNSPEILPNDFKFKGYSIEELIDIINFAIQKGYTRTKDNL